MLQTESQLINKNNSTKRYWSYLWRSYAIQTSWNYENQMNLGFLYGIAPELDRIYQGTDPVTIERKKEAYERHLAFYNCTPQTSAFVLGLTASMEEEYAKNPSSMDPSSINAMKSSLMGPLSGVGDSLLQGTIKILAFGLGIQFAREGSILGPIIAILISIIPALLITYYGGKLGYQGGHKFLKKLTETGTTGRIMHLVTLVGLMVIGAMIASMIGLTTPISTDNFSLQAVLDSIFPSMLSLGAAFFMYWLLSKKIGIGTILILTIVFGLLLSYLGILS